MRTALAQASGGLVSVLVVVAAACSAGVAARSEAAPRSLSASAGSSTGAPAAGSAATGTEARSRVRSGCTSDAAYEVCFSSPPSKGGKDASVVRRFIEVFDEAGAGDTLRIAMFRWDIPEATRAILGAAARGADVQVVADADVTTKAAGRALLAGLPAASTVICKGACLPWRGRGPAPPSQDVNHLKLLLADVGGRRSVITSSSNFEGRQYSQYNSLTRVFDDGLYDFASAYFQRLQAQSWTVAGTTWKDRQATYGGRDLTAMVYPRREDLVVNTLRQVRCVRGARSIDIMVAVLQRYDVRAQIGRLSREGCKIRIVTTRDLIENWLQAPFGLPGGRSADLPNDMVRTIVTHDKVYAIHAQVRGKERYLVLTGTSNTTCGGLLYNDELMLRLEGRRLYQTYRAHVLDAYGHAHQSRVGAVPVQAPCG